MECEFEGEGEEEGEININGQFLNGYFATFQMEKYNTSTKYEPCLNFNSYDFTNGYFYFNFKFIYYILLFLL